MEPHNNTTIINTLGAVLGIFAALVAIVGAVLGVFVYIDSRYISKDPLELKEIVERYNRDLANLIAKNEAALSAAVSANDSRLAELYRLKSEELKSLIVAVESVKERYERESSRTLDTQIENSVNRALGAPLKEKLDAYIRERTGVVIVSPVTDPAKNIAFGTSGPPMYFKTIDGHVYLSGIVTVRDLGSNQDASLLQLENAYRPTSDVDITAFASFSGGSNRSSIRVVAKGDGRIVARDTYCCNSGAITIAFANALIK